ncbi:MAG TPA: ACT domain-containing protein [Actinomycetota bacterium]
MHVAVTAIGVDRPGIVAAVTDVLLRHHCNIEDSRMATLGGHFAMMLIVATDADPAALELALQDPARSFDLIVSARPVPETPPAHAAGEQWVVSVYGADHPGIVARVTGALAAEAVNITDLATHVGEGDPPVYVMVLEVTLPPSLPGEELRGALDALAGELAVNISARPMDPETL